MLSLVARCRTMNTSVWKDELHVAAELGSLLLYFTVMDMGLREKQTLQKNQIYVRSVSCSRFMLYLKRRSEHFCIGFHFRRVRKIAKATVGFVMSVCPHGATLAPTKRIFMKFDICVFFQSLSTNSSFYKF